MSLPRIRAMTFGVSTSLFPSLRRYIDQEARYDFTPYWFLSFFNFVRTIFFTRRETFATSFQTSLTFLKFSCSPAPCSCLLTFPRTFFPRVSDRSVPLRQSRLLGHSITAVLRVPPQLSSTFFSPSFHFSGISPPLPSKYSRNDQKLAMVSEFPLFLSC